MTTTPCPGAPARPLRRARAAAGAAFFLQGLVFIPVTQRLPEIKRTWDLGELAVSGLLLMVVLLAGIGSAASELGARRWTSAGVLRIGCILTVIGLGTLGGIVATLGAITAAGLPLRWALPPMLAIPLVVAFAPFLPRDVELPVLDRESAVPWRPILLVGAALVAFYMVDTAATT